MTSNTMRAAILKTPDSRSLHPLSIETVPIPVPQPGEVLLKVKACGVCRTDLHIVAGELPQLLADLIPGHQIVGEVVESAYPHVGKGSRVGVSWIGGTDGTCRYCSDGHENLCDSPSYTGYSRNGGYAEYATARHDFVFPLPDDLEDLHAAPLLCAGIIGFRSVRVAEIEPGQTVGLWGFGASAHLVLPILKHWGCRVYVSTRGASHRELAKSLGAEWVGGESEQPPEPVDAAVTFAPSGDVVLGALKSLRKGGIVAVNAIHLDRIPEFDYDSLLWGERQIRSVANMTRKDARDFLTLAARLRIKPQTTAFSLEEANEALGAVKSDAINGAAVVVPG
jgi:propanol-preferring alcohol dehydrogenase